MLSGSITMKDIHSAAKRGKINEVAQELIRGVYVDTFDDGEYTPLRLACREGHAKLVEVLLNKGTQVNLCDTEGFHALEIACTKRCCG